MKSQQEARLCVGCGKKTTDTIECNCAQDVFVCGSCRESQASMRCGNCRELEHRTVYACLDFRSDPEPGSDTGGYLPVAAPVGAW